MDLIIRNTKAKENGCNGEKLGLSILNKIFNNVEFINSLVDAIADEKAVEIKTCQEWQKHRGKRRRGRFVLEKLQHKELLEKDGYYLFIVLSKYWYKFFLIKAKEIKYTRKLNWQRLETYKFELKGCVEYVPNDVSNSN